MNFIIWGLYYGCLLLMERFVLKDKLKQLPKPIQHIYTLTLVLIGWVFFMSPNLISAFKSIFTMLGFGATGVSDMYALFALRQNFILMLIAILFSMPIFDRIDNAILRVMKQRGVLISICFWFVLFLICLAFIVGNTFQSFLYFAF